MFCFLLNDNVYPKYSQHCKKRFQSMKLETLSLKIIINELDFLETSKKKDLQLFETKLTGKIPDPCNAKKYSQSFMTKKITKSTKQKIITQQPKIFESPNIVNIKSVIIEYPKTSHKLSSHKNIRKTEKVSQVGSNRSLCSDTKKVNIF